MLGIGGLVLTYVLYVVDITWETQTSEFPFNKNPSFGDELGLFLGSNPVSALLFGLGIVLIFAAVATIVYALFRW